MVEEVTLKPKFTVLYILIILAAIVALAVIAYLDYAGELNGEVLGLNLPSTFFFGVLFLSFVLLLAAFLKFVATTYIVSEKEVIAIEGLVTRTKKSVPLSKIDNLTVRRSVRDLIMGTGTIHVDTPGGPGMALDMYYIDAGKLDSVESLLKDLTRAKTEAHVEGKLEAKEAKAAPTEEAAADVPAQEKPAKKKPAHKKKSDFPA